MPAAPPTYVERLAIRARWWVVVLAIALFGSVEVSAGFTAPIMAIVVGAIVVPALVLLVLASRTVLSVDAEGVRVGTQLMAYADMESVEGLDAQRTRLMLGPQADPAARLFVRGFIREAVVVRPLRSAPIPYWLVSTRHPEQVVAAVEQAARASLAR